MKNKLGKLRFRKSFDKKKDIIFLYTLCCCDMKSFHIYKVRESALKILYLIKLWFQTQDAPQNKKCVDEKKCT